MKYFKGKKVLVYGMGRSGQSACKILYQNEACVSIYDDDKAYSNMFCFEPEPIKKEFDLVVVSPGVKVIGNEIISHFLNKKTPLISELDLGKSFCKGLFIAITGTNGKTTVTSLLGEIFKASGRETFVCGNIGLPLSSVALKTSKKSVVVCEVSNFQLELSTFFNPDIACILNLAEDHIDRHGNFAEYVRVKNKITQNFNGKNILVYNHDDINSNLVATPKKACIFSKNEQKQGSFVKDGIIYHNRTKVMPISEIQLKGEKNLENVLACIEIAMLCKVKAQFIRETIKNFAGLPHRLEYLGRHNGVDFYNDSKSTNIACIEMAIQSLKAKNLVLLVGGKNKDCNYAHLFNRGYDIKKVVCFGECGAEVYLLARNAGYTAFCYQTMKDAVLDVMKIAERGDVVLLSPGGASFDEFDSYVARGQVFKELVSGTYQE